MKKERVWSTSEVSGDLSTRRSSRVYCRRRRRKGKEEKRGEEIEKLSLSLCLSLSLFLAGGKEEGGIMKRSFETAAAVALRGRRRSSSSTSSTSFLSTSTSDVLENDRIELQNWAGHEIVTDTTPFPKFETKDFFRFEVLHRSRRSGGILWAYVIGNLCGIAESGDPYGNMFREVRTSRQDRKRS